MRTTNHNEDESINDQLPPPPAYMPGPSALLETLETYPGPAAFCGGSGGGAGAFVGYTMSESAKLGSGAASGLTAGSAFVGGVLCCGFTLTTLWCYENSRRNAREQARINQLVNLNGEAGLPASYGTMGMGGGAD